ncbi:UPF0175 family protein [Cupriavidus sp. 2SB]|uniref:UPF0175 family protein n=1 Tax=Cupriavidus sp. 2SB TaxID=2502199 RepID=UPI0010F5F62E|nr:UPF0175 family protein [Cupriavidus sp. 2SB]
MHIFSISELQECWGDLIREAEEGRLALVTRDGQLLFVSVPFTEELLQIGVHAALAVSLFKNGEVTSVRAAKLAQTTLSQFLAQLSVLGIAVVDYDPDELAQELAAFNGAQCAVTQSVRFNTD